MMHNVCLKNLRFYLFMTVTRQEKIVFLLLAISAVLFLSEQQVCICYKWMLMPVGYVQ
jgi:hypothetical protein